MTSNGLKAAMKVLWALGLVLVMLQLSEASDHLYSLTVPSFYTVFSGDLEFNYSLPGNVALPNGFVRLEFWSQSRRENMILPAMGLRLGFSSGTLRISCGVIEFAGNYTLRMYTRVNGAILAETTLDVRWPEVVLSLPDSHEAQTQSVELRIISNANCSSLLQRHFWKLKLLFQRSLAHGKTLNISESDVIFEANFTSINVPYTTVPFGCYLFDLDGVYQVSMISSSPDSPLVSVSNVMTVKWSSGYYVSVTTESAFPCLGSISLIYTHPACSALDKFRLYSYTPISQGSFAAPLEAAYVTEVLANPDRTQMAFDCRLFNQSATGFCFVYVSITKGNVVSEQAKACIPARANSVFPIDGSWSKWTSWTSCSVTCGAGKKSRFRMCNDPAPKHGGRFCAGDPVEWTPCELHCPESIPRTPLHSPQIDPNCACGCTREEDKGQIIATGRCYGLSTWLIKVRDGNLVALHFDYFYLNYTRQWVKVRDGTSATDVLLFSSSNQGHPLEVVTTGTVMRVEFMTSYVTPPPNAVFPKNATLPIHTQGFIASFEVRAILMSSTAPVLFQYTEETVMGSKITIVGIIICAVVIIVAIVFVVAQRTFFRTRVKYTMTSSGESPAHQSQTAGSSTEHRVSSAQSSGPSSPGNTINVDMEVPLTGKVRRKANNGKNSRTSSLSSLGSQKMKQLKSKGDNGSTGKGGNNSPKPVVKEYVPVTSPYGIEIIDIDEKGSTEKISPTKLKTPRTPKLQAGNHKHSPKTPLSPITKLDLLNKKRQDIKGKGVTADIEREITGSSGSRSPSTTKAEVNWPHSSFVRAALNEVSRSLAEKPKYSGQRPPSEEIPLLDSMTSSIESPSHFNNMVKSDSTDSATTCFVRPVSTILRRPTSLTESYSNESIPKPKPKIDVSTLLPAMPKTQPKPQSNEPAILPVHSVQLSSTAIPPSYVNNKYQQALPSITSSKNKHLIKPSPSQTSLNSDKSARKQRTAFEERLTILPKPDGQSPKLQRREFSAANEKEPISPGRASRSSSKSSKNTVSSPAHSIATPSEAEGLELEYDDFVEDDPLSYFDYEETQKLAFRGVERLGKSKVPEEEEDEV